MASQAHLLLRTRGGQWVTPSKRPQWALARSVRDEAKTVASSCLTAKARKKQGWTTRLGRQLRDWMRWSGRQCAQRRDAGPLSTTPTRLHAENPCRAFAARYLLHARAVGSRAGTVKTCTFIGKFARHCACPHLGYDHRTQTKESTCEGVGKARRSERRSCPSGKTKRAPAPSDRTAGCHGALASGVAHG